jgi:hypothetical protein
MATKFAAAAGRKKSPIDLPLAAAAGLAVGFAAFVMPGDVLSNAVTATGLPELLPMAAPPLGMKARAAIAIAGAGGTFAFVFLLLRMLGGKGAPRREREAAAFPFELDEAEAQAPRLRRADIHPDAPARRPILAVRELGEPDPVQAGWAPRNLEPEPAPLPEPERAWQAESEREPEPQSAPEPQPAPLAAADNPFDELELSGPDIEMIVALPEPDPAPEPEQEGMPVEGESISDLMERLERGLARRIGHKEVAAATAHAAQPHRAPAATPTSHGGDDDRLRSAMENLQRLAARAG